MARELQKKNSQNEKKTGGGRGRGRLEIIRSRG